LEIFFKKLGFLALRFSGLLQEGWEAAIGEDAEIAVVHKLVAGSIRVWPWQWGG